MKVKFIENSDPEFQPRVELIESDGEVKSFDWVGQAVEYVDEWADINNGTLTQIYLQIRELERRRDLILIDQTKLRTAHRLLCERL